MDAGFSADRVPQDGPPSQERRSENDRIDVRAGLVTEYTSRFLTLISHGTDRDSKLEPFLHQLESRLSEVERKLVVNATLPHSGQGVNYFLASQQKLFSPQNLHLLLKAGLDLEATFSIKLERGHRSHTLTGINIYHCAGLYGRRDLLDELPVLPRLQNARNSAGETPALFTLKYASDNHHATRGLEALSHKGIDLEARDENGRQLFHYALRYRQNTLIKMLAQLWKEQDLSPISSLEARSAIALTIINADLKGYRAARRRIDLIESLPTSPQPHEVLVMGLPLGLSRYLGEESKGSNRHLQKMLNRLHDNRQSIGKDLTASLLNSRVNGSDQSFFSRLYLHSQTLESAHAAQRLILSGLRLGADPTPPFTARSRSTDQEVLAPMVHHAAINNNLEIFRRLIEWDPSQIDALDSNGNTPLMAHLDANVTPFRSRVNRNTVQQVIKMGADLSHRNHHGHDAVDLTIRAGELECLLYLLQRGAQPPRGEEDRIYESKTAGIELNYTQLVHEAVGIFHGLKRLPYGDRIAPVQLEAREILSHTRSVHHTYLYLVACREACEIDLNVRLEPGGGTPLLSLAQSLLFRPPPSRLTALWNLIETVSDSVREVRDSNYHKNEAEMMLLINTPEVDTLYSENLNDLTRALTSISRFIDLNLPKISGLPVWNFARVGLYSHGFHQILRYETQGAWDYSPKKGWHLTGPSLLESQLQFFPVKSDRSICQHFGPSFLLIGSQETPLPSALLAGRDGRVRELRFDPRTVIVLSRGIAIVANPDMGTLIIRNSSPTFGRNLLKHAAYWSPPRGYSRVDSQALLNLSIESVESSFYPILDPHLYLDTAPHTVRAPKDDPAQQIHSLLRELDVFREYRRRSTFDTSSHTAFVVQDGQPMLSESGGYRSPHFAAHIKFLEQRYAAVTRELQHTGKSTREVPDLIFGRPFYPAWAGYRYHSGGEMHSRLKITPDVLTVLRAYADNSFVRRTHKLAIETGVHAFLQEAGFDSHGELMMVSPK